MICAPVIAHSLSCPLPYLHPVSPSKLEHLVAQLASWSNCCLSPLPVLFHGKLEWEGGKGRNFPGWKGMEDFLEWMKFFR